MPHMGRPGNAVDLARLVGWRDSGLHGRGGIDPPAPAGVTGHVNGDRRPGFMKEGLPSRSPVVMPSILPACARLSCWTVATGDDELGEEVSQQRIRTAGAIWESDVGPKDSYMPALTGPQPSED